MARFILIISAILMVCGIVLAIMNRSDFIETRSEKDRINEQLEEKIEDVDKLVEDLETAYTALNTAENERDLAEVGIGETNRKIDTANRLLASEDEKIKQAQAEIAEIDAIFQPYKEKGITPETLQENLDEMQQQLTQSEDEIAALEQEIEVMNQQISKNEEAASGYEEEQAARSSALALNEVEANVTAVNSDWGFAVIDAGRNRGVVPDAKVIVRRGGEQIGRLSILSVEPGMTIADIDEDSLRRGASILPGDQVVFEIQP